MADVTSPQPGWYADPENPAGERWWNGSDWSEHKRTSTVAGDPAAAGTASVVPPVPPAPVPPVAPDSSGFTFGSPTPVGAAARPDPYSPVPPTPTQPYYGSPYAPAPYGATYGSGTNGLALAGLIVSAAGWLVIPILAPIAGIILSAIGLRLAKQREGSGIPNAGRGMALAGLIVGIVILAFTLIGVIVIIVASMASYNYSYNYG